MNEHYIRLGLLRATATMGMPGVYANMCIFILPLIIYLYEIRRQKRYLLSAGLCILAIVHSGCRSVIFYLFLLFAIYVTYIFRTKARRLLFLKHTTIIVSSILTFTIIASISNPYWKY